MGLRRLGGRFWMVVMVWLLVVAGQGFAADPPPRATHKLSWKPGFRAGGVFDPEVSSNSKADIKKQLKTDWYHTFELKSPEKPGLTRSVKTCEEFFAALEYHMVPVKWSEFYYYISHGLQCQAARLIVAGQDAKLSYLNDFKLDETILDRFPPELAYLISNDEIARVHNDKTINNWRKAGELVSFEVENAYTVHTKSRIGDSQHLYLLARGDFNGDGFEDILVKTNNKVGGGGSHASTGLFLLTRTSADPMFRLVKEYKAR